MRGAREGELEKEVQVGHAPRWLRLSGSVSRTEPHSSRFNIAKFHLPRAITTCSSTVSCSTGHLHPSPYFSVIFPHPKKS